MTVTDIRKRLGVRPVINVSGTMTSLGASIVVPEAIEAITAMLSEFVEIDDLSAVERLPDTTGLKNEVPILLGHMTSYGAPVEQAIRLTGAKVVPVGQATYARRYQLEGAITERTAAAVYVVSHHVVHYGLIPLDEFAAVCHARGVPVIVDAASEYDLKGFLAQGADIALYSPPSCRTTASAAA